MKKMKFTLINLQYLFMVLLGISVFAISCETEEGTGDIPGITLSSVSTANSIGSEVSTQLSISAPEGLVSIMVFKNGAPFVTEPINGQPKSLDWEFKYIVDSPIGSTVNFSFQALDGLNRTSTLSVFSVQVTTRPIKEIPAGNLLGIHNWYADTIYRINGFVRVGKDEPQAGGGFINETGTLNIEAGTLIIGDKQSKATLVVQRGSKIFAWGKKEAPIVMTSEEPVGLRLPGDWGGLVLCGRAKNNQGSDVQLEGGYGAWFGGDKELDDVSESSGVIQYLRIEYAGVPINPNEEINSLTMGSVGKGTVIEYVQASYGLDDAFEWFGGSVDCKYLIAYRGVDDEFDVDFGYSGTVQFGIGIRDAAMADQSGSNGFEVDNNGQGTAAEPFTEATFSNITLIGPKKTRETSINTNFQHGAQLRRNSRIKINNSFISGYPWGIYIDDSRGATSQHIGTDHLRLRNVIVAGVREWGGNGYGNAFDAAIEGTVNGLPFGTLGNHPNAPRGISLRQDNTQGFNVITWFNTIANNNKRLSSWEEAGIDPTVFDLTPAPGLLPMAGSLLLTGAKWDNVPDANKFEQVDYIGAFGLENWAADWTEFVPGIKVYY